VPPDVSVRSTYENQRFTSPPDVGVSAFGMASSAKGVFSELSVMRFSSYNKNYIKGQSIALKESNLIFL
jgi:hypothetical protein